MPSFQSSMAVSTQSFVVSFQLQPQKPPLTSSYRHVRPNRRYGMKQRSSTCAATGNPHHSPLDNHQNPLDTAATHPATDTTHFNRPTGWRHTTWPTATIHSNHPLDTANKEDITTLHLLPTHTASSLLIHHSPRRGNHFRSQMALPPLSRLRIHARTALIGPASRPDNQIYAYSSPGRSTGDPSTSRSRRPLSRRGISPRKGKAPQKCGQTTWMRRTLTELGRMTTKQSLKKAP